MRQNIKTSVEMAEAVKILFREHGGDLPTVIASMFMTLSERCADLEGRVKELEGK